MKNYTAPEMEIMAFAAENSIAGIAGLLLSGNDNFYNEDQFGSW